MAKKQGKKRVVISSILSLILCLSMLIGTTMAWFTDTVTNTGNRIETGGLGVQLLKYNGTEYVDISEDDGKGDIFMTEGAEGERLNGVLWESGKTEVVYLQVKNNGTLALNYNILLDIQNDENNTAKLNEALTYAIVPGDYSQTPFASWSDIIASENVETDGVPEGEVTAAENGALLAGASDYFALAVHMDEEAGNMYQHQLINIDVKITAKQMPYEKDSFGSDYDTNAEFEKEEVEEEEEEQPEVLGNLFLDPSFETLNANGIGFVNWSLQHKNITKAWGNSHSVDTEKYVTGKQSLKLSTSTSSPTQADCNAGVRQDVIVEAGATYIVSGYFMVDQAVIDNKSTVNVAINLAQYDANSGIVVAGKNYALYGNGSSASSIYVLDEEEVAAVEAGKWIPFSFEYEIAANAKSVVSFLRQLLPYGTVWFDDVCFEKYVEPENLLENPGFEVIDTNSANCKFSGWHWNITNANAASWGWGTTHSADVKDVKEGNVSCKVSDGSRSAYVFQNVACEVNANYEVSGWFMVPADVTLDATVRAVVQIDGNNIRLFTTKATEAVKKEDMIPGKWIYFKTPFTAKKESVEIQFRAWGSGTVWFDDLCVTKVTTE